MLARLIFGRCALGLTGVLALVACTTPQLNNQIATSASASSTTQALRPISADNGWAGYVRPITGGAAAGAQRTHVVRNRAQLIAALSAAEPTLANEPKIIQIEGVVDLSVDEQNRPLQEEGYRDPEFSWSSYEASYAPATWGKRSPEGKQELARARSARNQERVVVIAVGSNTTLVGVGPGATIKNGGLRLQGVENIVIRNISFEDAYDYFPQWDPTDNAEGEWNAAYDNISLVNARRVWIDFCTFSDGARPDRLNRRMFGRPMQFHDGLVDIIRQSDLITISNSVFRNHDKVMLIGNSDKRTEDAGYLRVTLHGNWFDNVKERAPRVRFGQVHVYNNLYSTSLDSVYPYGYSIGIGVGSRLIAESNAFLLPSGNGARAFRWWGGSAIDARENLYFDGGEWRIVDPNVSPIGRVSGVRSSTVGWQVPYEYVRLSPVTLSKELPTRAGAGTRFAQSKAIATREKGG